MEQLKIVEEIKKRTLVPNWNGMKYTNGSFFNAETITDAQAISALKNNALRETHFIKLPESYNVLNEKITPKVVTRKKRK